MVMAMEYIFPYSSPIGSITLASDGQALTGLWFDGQRFFAENLSKEHQVANLPIFDETTAWLDLYFGGKVPDFTPALHIHATPFRRAVWEILQTIPYGQTTTYGEIAKTLAKQKGISRMSAQAVGNAVGHNPISLLIPCHRVIGKNYQLTGYAAGLDKKRYLLELEHNVSQQTHVACPIIHPIGSC